MNCDYLILAFFTLMINACGPDHKDISIDSIPSHKSHPIPLPESTSEQGSNIMEESQPLSEDVRGALIKDWGTSLDVDEYPCDPSNPLKNISSNCQRELIGREICNDTVYDMYEFRLLESSIR